MRLLSFIIFSFGFLLIEAQPVITTSVSPEVGDSYTINYLDDITLNPGNAGENQNWDFSNLAQDVEFHYKFIAPSAAPGNENFPDADCVWQFVEFESFNFYKKTDNAIVTIGGLNGNDQFINFLLIYQDDNEAMNLPITYNTRYDYTSTYDEYLFGNYMGTQTRTSKLTADAYGTLITPNGTYQDVLRIKIEYDDPFGFNSTQYAWFDTEDFIPLLQYELSTDPDQPPYVVIAKNDNSTTAVKSPVETDVSIYYLSQSFGNDQFVINADQSYKDLNIQIFDSQMRLVHGSRIDQLVQGKNNIRLTLDLSPGVYVAELIGRDSRTTAQFYKP